MVRRSKTLTAFAHLLIATGPLPLAAQAACQRPSAISVPDGATSSFEDMLAAQSDLEAYMAAMESYLACINEDLAAGGDDAPTEFKAAQSDTHSSAVTELETVAAAFSRELQSFFRVHPELKNAPPPRTRSAPQAE
jgi:Mlc titration factor MtfA (ptsG expression regulator)